MTKREFFENELKMMPSEIGSAVPMNVNGEKDVTEAWLMAFVKHLVEDLKEAKNWHTGTPTEDGWYLVATENLEKPYPYGVAQWHDGYGWGGLGASNISLRDIVAWQEIEPFKETE